MSLPFIHLNVHSEYSLKDSLISIKELIAKTVQLGMPAIAVTDLNNLFAMVKFYQKAEAAGLKPIIGSEIFINNPDDPHHPFSLILLCQTELGYRNLTRLISESYLNAKHNKGRALVDKLWLQGPLSIDLIAISPSQDGEIAQAISNSQTDKAIASLKAWNQVFDRRFFLEITRVNKAADEAYIQALLKLSETHDCHLVASNRVRFIDRNDFEAHEARVCIQSGYTLDDPKRPQNYVEEQYLKSSTEMNALFEDLPEALENSFEIAKRCNLQLKLNQVFLPNFPVPGALSVEEYLSQEARKGLYQRKELQELDDAHEARLETELNVINKMGFAGYFLIVADFIRWAKAHQIPVGPGRGSGAGSLVAFALDITDINPLDYDLLFERFLNPERVSMPDFDIDFCMEGRDKVIDYVAERYGRDAVSQIITYGSMAAKAVIRDVGRVLGHNYGFVDRIAKLIPLELGITLSKALEQDEALRLRYKGEEEVKILIDLALKLEGLTRNVGKHAGGVVIAPSRLTDYTPLYCDPEEQSLVTQFDKNDVETIGLVKFDFLGLRTLTIIDWALQTVNQVRQASGLESISLTKLPLDDIKTFKLLRACQTTALFQLESRGMKDLIGRLKPDVFEDIIALVALFRPGPLQSGMVDDFINRKHGRAALEYPHPALEPILKPTYGIILYQEQVMQIAQVLAGYTLGSADLLRRAMGKKNAAEMANQRTIFTEGATLGGISPELATYIFDLMEKFAGYGFNKSHSAAYALLTYQTAWIKAHYPAAFMAAVLSSDMTNTDKVVVFIEECRALRLKVIPPNINRSFHKFTVTPDNEIVYGLGAIKGVGEAAILNMVECRGERPFKDLYDLCARVDTKRMTKRMLEALLRSGTLDPLSPDRASLSASLDDALAAALQLSQNQLLGQGDLFANHFETTPESRNQFKPALGAWSESARLKGEKETLGLYLTGHPIDEYQLELAAFTSSSLKHIKPIAKKEQVFAGIIHGLRSVQTKRGDRLCILTLEDKSARQEVTLFGDTYQNNRDRLIKDDLIVIHAEVTHQSFSNSNRVRVSKVFSLTEARVKYAKSLQITLKPEKLTQEFFHHLMTFFNEKDPRKSCPITIAYDKADVVIQLKLGDKAWVVPSKDKLDALSVLCDKENLRMIY